MHLQAVSKTLRRPSRHTPLPSLKQSWAAACLAWLEGHLIVSFHHRLSLFQQTPRSSRLSKLMERDEANCQNSRRVEIISDDPLTNKVHDPGWADR